MALTLGYVTIQDLKYTEKSVGKGITITYRDGGTAGSETVTVSNSRLITVTIANGVSTAAQIKTAVEANPQANELVTISVTGTAGNAQVTCVEATLSGGTAAVAASLQVYGLTVVAKTAGTGGNSIRLQFAEGSDAVSVNSNDITVTFTSGATAASVAAQLNANEDAAALVTAYGSSANTLRVAMNPSLTALAGGAAAVAASVEVQDLTFSADTAGTSGNGATVTYTTGATAGAEVVSVNSDDISIQIENGVSTATQVKAAFDASEAANGNRAEGTVTVLDWANGNLTAATGAITYGTPDVATAAVAASGTVEVVDYTKLAEATATASGDITFGTPDPTDTVVVTGPDGGPYTFTCVASDPEAGEFVDADQLAYLINTIVGLDAANVAGTISLTVETAGTVPNDWTVTGTGTFSALNITFSGGQDHAVLTVNGTPLVEGTDWDAASDNDTTAASLELAIEAVTDITSSATAAAITVEAATAGAAGNAYTLATSDVTNLTISGATLTGGADAIAASTITFNDGTEHVFTCVAATPGANEFSSISELSALFDALDSVSASQDGTDVTITAATAGAAANAFTLAHTGAGLTPAAATLTGGIDALSITVGTSTVVEGTDFNAASSNNTTATNLAAAIDALPGVSAAAVGAVVTITSDTYGTGGNTTVLVTSDAAVASVSGATLSGGTAAFACAVSGTGSNAQHTVNAAPMSGAVGVGPRAYFRDEGVTALTSSFVAFNWSFPSKQLTIVNDETSGTKTVLISFDGTSTHYELAFGETLSLDADVAKYGVWLKYGSGAPAYRLMVIGD